MNLTHKWDIWFHNEKDNWTLSGYKKIYEITSINDFWKFYNNWELAGGVTNKHFFIMQDGIIPIWEDVKNINGGCWSFKIHEDQAEELWEDLSIYMVCNKLLPSINNEIVGLSICLKKNNNVVIKIWNRNSKVNSLKLLNDKILKKWGMDIIYIAHMSGQK
jgi:hypothetical protein